MRQDIEASVIGGLLIGGLTPTASDVLATLEPEAFSIPLYRKAFEVIRKQARNRNLIDGLMVAEECGDEYATAVMMTARSCPSAANLKGYAGMVADSYQRRQVLQLLDEMREPISNGTLDASGRAMDELVKRLSSIRKPRNEVKPVRLGEIINDYTDTLDRRLRNGEESDSLGSTATSNQLAAIAPTLGQQWLSGQMNNYQNLANIGLGALQGQANAGQTYANNMSQISQQSAALAAANANRPSAMQSAIGGGASGAIAGAGLAKLIGSSTPWGAAIGGGIGLLGSLF